MDERLLAKPLFQATLEDLSIILDDLFTRHGNISPEKLEKPSKKYIYGLAGIQQLLSCSLSTAYRIKKSGVINSAISQVGRIMVIDAELAIDLLKMDTKYLKHPSHRQVFRRRSA